MTYQILRLQWDVAEQMTARLNEACKTGKVVWVLTTDRDLVVLIEW